MNELSSSPAQPTHLPQGQISRGPISGGPISRLVRAGSVGLAIAAGSIVGSAVVSPAPQAAAVSAAMPTNTMASVVTSSADQALASYDSWLSTDDPAAYRSYVWFRTQTAQFAAAELGYPQLDMVEAWAATPLEHQRAVLAAMTQVGVPYRSNTSKAGVGFDCSGLTTYAWGMAGVQITRQSSSQIRESLSLDRSQAKAGDLVQYPGHVMMYLGVGDAVIHSVMSGRTVELDTISERRAQSVRFGDPVG